MGTGGGGLIPCCKKAARCASSCGLRPIARVGGMPAPVSSDAVGALAEIMTSITASAAATSVTVNPASYSGAWVGINPDPRAPEPRAPEPRPEPLRFKRSRGTPTTCTAPDALGISRPFRAPLPFLGLKAFTRGTGADSASSFRLAARTGSSATAEVAGGPGVSGANASGTPGSTSGWRSNIALATNSALFGNGMQPGIPGGLYPGAGTI